MPQASFCCYLLHSTDVRGIRAPYALLGGPYALLGGVRIIGGQMYALLGGVHLLGGLGTRRFGDVPPSLESMVV